MTFTSDLGNPTLNGGGGLVLGRVQSPVMNESQSLGSLSANTLLNSGYQSLSNSTSPILSQGPGKYPSDFINLLHKFEYW